MTELYLNGPTTMDDSLTIVAKLERRHDLPDEAWRRLRRFFPRRAKTGRPPRDTRAILDGVPVLWVLATGAPWRDLPTRFGPWQTVYGRYCVWIETGLLDRIFAQLRPSTGSG